MAACALLGPACATMPATPPAPVVSVEEKMAWILQLEDQRILRLPPPPAIEAPPPQRGRVTTVPPQPPPADLVILLRDAEPRIRRRAAIAIGRVKLAEGVAALTATLADSDPDVRAMAAFGLGLIGDAGAEPALVPVLSDVEPVVRGRAAEALGLIGAKGAADAIGHMVAEYARSAPVLAMQPDDETRPAAGEVEAFKLGLFALVRLRAYEPLAAAVLEGGRPVSSWWPVAYALQRVGDARAAPALLQLLNTPGRYTRAFAARGLGGIRDAMAAEPLIGLLDPSAEAGREVTVAAIRALAQIGAPAAARPLAVLASTGSADSNLRLEAVTALGMLDSDEGLPVVQDLMTDPWPAMRAAAIEAAARIDADAFIAILAGMERDRHWRVRAALASTLGTLPPDLVTAPLTAMLDDEDKRVLPSVLASLARLQAPGLPSILLARLKDPDFALRAAVARQIGKLKPDGGAEALREAYEAALPDAAYAARAAILEALVEYGPAAAGDTLRTALSDKDWAVRIRAAELMARIGQAESLDAVIRPAPATPVAPYTDPQLIAPEYSPRVFIDTAHGAIELELAVLDAPQTARNFMALARRGFFNGLEVHRVVANFVMQDGDPRGDGMGGPGYTIRDELNDRPFVRGTVGMALDWRDTGGSQFFIMHSPHPHLDALYTAFGHVVDGMDVVDRIRPGDVIQRVRVWDGNGW